MNIYKNVLHNFLIFLLYVNRYFVLYKNIIQKSTNITFSFIYYTLSSLSKVKLI